MVFDTQGLTNSISSMLDQLGSQALILTPNERLARVLQTQIARANSQKGMQAWEEFPCYSISSWFTRLWDANSLSLSDDEWAKTPIDGTQAAEIWKNIIESDAEAELFSAPATAHTANSAWQQTKINRCINEVFSEGLAEFKRWAIEYERRLDNKALIDATGVELKILAAIEEGQIKLPKTIGLFSFDDKPASLKQLMRVAEPFGTEFHPMEFNRDASIVRTKAFDRIQEITKAAFWAKQQLIEANSKQEPIKIGIVVPKLNQYRAKVERIFYQVFEPQQVLASAVRHAPPFNISATTKLSESHIINTALSILRLSNSTFTIEEYSAFLHSPYYGNIEDLHFRSQIARQLKEQYVDLSFKAFRQCIGAYASKISAIENLRSSGVEQLYQNLHELSLHKLGQSKGNSLNNPTSSRLPSEWLEVFKQRLQLLSWPGERTLDTIEYQQIKVWQECLAKFSQYDAVFGKLHYTSAVQLFENLVSNTAFHLQTGDSPIQILGVYEAAGLVFDKLWVMHMDSDNWPLSINPNALIPRHIQKKYNMPLACAERETYLAQTLTRRFIKSAHDIVFSSAESDGDRMCTVSKVIESFPEHELNEIEEFSTSMHPYWNAQVPPTKLEHFNDQKSGILPTANEGGSNILKEQSACPFRAFSLYRLGVREHYPAQLGIGPLQKGSLVHFSLEHLWNDIGSKIELLALNQEALTTKVRQAINEAAKRLQKHSRFSPAFLEIEKARLEKLVHALLKLESQRPDFVVASTESSASIQLSGLTINFRLDRKDQVSENGVFVIDYKTNLQTIGSWFGRRPDEPQVPLYAIANKDTSIGLAFSTLHKDKVAFVGLIEDGEQFSELKDFSAGQRYDAPEQLHQLLEYWEHNLMALAGSFVNGEAHVSPNKGAQTCQRCQFSSFCRIHELNQNRIANGACPT